MLKDLAACAAIAVLAGSPAFSATVGEVTYSNNNSEISVRHGDFPHQRMPQPPKGQKAIFSNIDTYYPYAVYFPFEGAGIAGPQTLHGVNSVAVQFMPTADANVSQISAAVGITSGTGDFDLAIYSDNNGAPGTSLGGGEVKDIQTFGDCCDLASVKVSGLSLSGGTAYWMVVTADSDAPDAQGGWNFNTIDETDIVTMATNRGSGWSVSNDYNAVPAFAIYGK